eukprot:12305194-Alexandrium_andersonii.AAC.1
MRLRPLRPISSRKEDSGRGHKHVPWFCARSTNSPARISRSGASPCASARTSCGGMSRLCQRSLGSLSCTCQGPGSRCRARAEHPRERCKARCRPDTTQPAGGWPRTHRRASSHRLHESGRGRMPPRHRTPWRKGGA